MRNNNVSPEPTIATEGESLTALVFEHSRNQAHEQRDMTREERALKFSIPFVKWEGVQLSQMETTDLLFLRRNGPAVLRSEIDNELAWRNKGGNTYKGRNRKAKINLAEQQEKAQRLYGLFRQLEVTA